MNQSTASTDNISADESELAEIISEVLERDSRRYSGFRETEAKP